MTTRQQRLSTQLTSSPPLTARSTHLLTSTRSAATNMHTLAASCMSAPRLRADY